MTDNDIKKALELCATLDSSNCKKCPCREICKENDGTLTKSTLDLIKRQKAENERLEKELMKCKLEKEMLYQTVEEIKSEAIKEFADIFENKLHTCDVVGDRDNVGYITSDVHRIIYNLVKERTE